MTAQSAGLEQRARELLSKWRADGRFYLAGGEGDKSVAYDACADELEAALAAPAADGVDDVLHKLDEWCRAYPESVFPEPTKEDFDAVNSVFPNAVTRISASMGRHMVKHMREMADAIRAAAPQAQGEGDAD